MELLHTLTPFILLVVSVGVGIIGWFIKDLRSDLGKRLDKMEADIDKLETARSADQKWMYEHCVVKEVFYMSVGESKALVGKIFDELKEVNRLVNQQIGAMNVKGER